MTHNAFLIICATFIAGIGGFFCMGFAAGHGASMFEVHVIGFFIAGLGVAWSLHGN